MKKKLFLSFLLVAITSVVMAIPVKPGMWKTIKLTNGTEVRVERVGDEHGHWLRAADGTCYVKGAEGYVKADAEQLQAKREARMASKSAKRRAIYASTSDGLGKKGTMSMGAVPSIGEYTIPVVMVQFSDVKFKSTTTVEKMRRYYNEEGYHDETGAVGSVRDYFKAQSGGQFVPTFDVVGIVTLNQDAVYYGGNDSDGNDQGLDNLPGDVISAAVTQLGTDFSQYVVPAGDENHKAGVPLLAMFYAGKGEATEYSGAEDCLWPCEWDDIEDPVGGGTYKDVHFNSFFVGNELMGSKLMGMSVFCHEFGHALGLPDFYCTDYSYDKDDPFGLWSIMDSGAYVDDECRLPVGYNAYEKSYLGWLELKEFGDADEVTLQSPEGLAEGSAYIVRNSSTETFILENRQPGTWYPSDFGSGVLVSRIAYSYNQWKNNTLNNTQNKKRACVLTANGAKLYYSASSANLYGYSKTSIGSLKTRDDSTKDMGVKKVTKNNDGTITLTLNEGGVTPTPTGDGDFAKVTSDAQIVSGNEYVLICESKSKGSGVFNDKYLSSVDVEISDATASGEGLSPFTLGGNSSGYSIKLVDGSYLTTSEAKKMSTTNSEDKCWLIESTSNGYVLTTESYGVVQFNPSAPRFLNYTSNQTAAVLYIKASADGIISVEKLNGERVIYNLAGQRVENPTRGLYIINGKKVMLR